MMGWEKPLMIKHAQLMCHKPGLDIINIGFGAFASLWRFRAYSVVGGAAGLGLFDSAVQELKPRRHVICEAHPDVFEHMKVRLRPSRHPSFHSPCWCACRPKAGTRSLAVKFALDAGRFVLAGLPDPIVSSVLRRPFSPSLRLKELPSMEFSSIRLARTIKVSQ
jgi:hypothetical protein